MEEDTAESNEEESEVMFVTERENNPDPQFDEYDLYSELDLNSGDINAALERAGQIFNMSN